MRPIVWMLAAICLGTAAEEPDLLAKADVVAAIKETWNYSSGGRSRFEVSFRLDGNPSAYRLIVTPPNHQFRHHTVPIIPGVTFAIFHVHTDGSNPVPSPADRTIADQYKLKIYTIHIRGLYEYDPATRRTTKLRDGIAWMERPIR